MWNSIDMRILWTENSFWGRNVSRYHSTADVNKGGNMDIGIGSKDSRKDYGTACKQIWEIADLEQDSES